MDANTLAPADLHFAACQLAADYGRSLDFRDYDWLPGLFLPEATLLDPVLAAQPLTGHDAIRQALGQRSHGVRSRQLLANGSVQPLANGEAMAVHYVTLYQDSVDPALGLQPAPLSGPWAVGHWQDRLAWADGRWLFRSRTLHLAFRRAD